MRLFDFERANRAPVSKCTDLVPLDRVPCHRCGAATRREEVAEYALLRHGGYGATRLSVFHACTNLKCRQVRTVQVVETAENTRRRRP